METEIRRGKAPFIDKSHFPEGFANYAVFTQLQAEQLKRYGETLVGLECGIKFPQNSEEKQFVDFCRHNKTPVTELERLWANYRAQIYKRQYAS